jgi:hypothetical protein
MTLTNPAEANERTKLQARELFRRIGSIANGFMVELQRDLNRQLRTLAEVLPSAHR